jgi:hypothetical protein
MSGDDRVATYEGQKPVDSPLDVGGVGAILADLAPPFAGGLVECEGRGLA